jgi:hypothetical protein
VVWSLLSADAPCGVSGLTTEATFGVLATSAAAVLTASAYFWSVSLPFGAWSTIGLVPLAWAGNAAVRASVACWLSVPGSDKSSFVLSPSVCETSTNTIAQTTHAASTKYRFAIQKRPRAYRTLVIPPMPPPTRRRPPIAGRSRQESSRLRHSTGVKLRSHREPGAGWQER